MEYILGLDAGSVNIKTCLIASDGRLLKTAVAHITSNTAAAVNAAIVALGGTTGISAAGISGSGQSVIPASCNWGIYTSPLAIASGLLQDHPEARTIIQIGGQNSLIVQLEDGLAKPWKVFSNPLCAAGTGRFLEQQAYRLDLGIDAFSRLALEHHGPAPRIAARCSVFAKSDLIHLQQKGVSLPTMLFALCESIARLIASLNRGEFAEPVYFVGGMAANGAIVQALQEMISARNGHEVKVIVPRNYLFTEAYGAALLSRNLKSELIFPLPAGENADYYRLPALRKCQTKTLPAQTSITRPVRGYLGVDIGSTSTKAVILDETGREVLAKNYIMTSGRPIDAVKQLFHNLLDEGAGAVDILGAGVTGSGRYLIGNLIGADLVKNEITAQTQAAAEIDPRADIIEIGGQDSKLVIKKNGVVVDYQMNKACAAGTGSFIDELADMLGVRVTNGDFARLAFSATYTIDLGTRCAAFMAQAVALAQQQGIPLEIITASLSDSIAKNYLSKVVGHRKLGPTVILTGAVFYNESVVAAFQGQLPEKVLIVAPHREVSGAIGAALLAKETINGRPSGFKGLKHVADKECHVSTFICKSCDNNCTITRMTLDDEAATFYGSRCDRYDSQLDHQRLETLFDERQKLLLSEYREGAGQGAKIGVPRALLTYDLAPLFLGFLNSLGVRVLLSNQTNAEIMARSVELAYTDSCFPLKLMHGHVASLSDRVDYVFYPSAIRLGPKQGDENQKYACPLVQASPFIVREALNLGGRLISPTLDFSLGDGEVVRNLTNAARVLGFSRKRGESAALDGLRSQRQFELNRAALGTRRLEELEASGKLGVVLISRAYMAQDAGANLGISETLARLGVTPIPLDFLPMDTVNPLDYSDRPYWSYEAKFIAAAAIIARNPNLFGLMLTNFGCGPNSFILPLIEDIMGGKPLGQLEIDEHAAEAGLVTRLEAFVDTIRSYAPTAAAQQNQTRPIRRAAKPISNTGRTFVLPYMAPFVEVLSAAIASSGNEVIVLPETDERSLNFSSQVTAGTECLPYRVTLGDILKFMHDHPDRREDVEILMAGSYGPCRLGKYALELGVVLRAEGFEVPLGTSMSNAAYRDINLGSKWQRSTVKAMFAVDCLEKLTWRSRPYEKEPGAADRLFGRYLQKLMVAIRTQQSPAAVIAEATREFGAVIDAALPRRPLVGINGEIFLRTNRFSNDDLVRRCENAGLEVTVSPLTEWLKYTSYRNLEDHRRFRRLRKIPASFIKDRIISAEEQNLTGITARVLGDGHEPSIAEILARTEKYLSPRCGSEAVLSIGGGIEWLEKPEFAGVISVMPHGCMPGGIVAAMAEKVSQAFHKPWVSLTYDGIMETNNLTKISNFAEVVKFCARR